MGATKQEGEKSSFAPTKRWAEMVLAVLKTGVG